MSTVVDEAGTKGASRAEPGDRLRRPGRLLARRDRRQVTGR